MRKCDIYDEKQTYLCNTPYKSVIFFSLQFNNNNFITNAE